MVTDGKEYRDRVSVAEENLKIFKRSVEQCNVPVMLDNSARFLETIKNADNLFLQLHPKIRENEKSTYSKSQSLLREYFNIRYNIGSFCECKTQPSRS